MSTKLYQEHKTTGNEYRQKQLLQINELIRQKRDKADVQRSRFFKPDYLSIASYEESTKVYREKFIDMLGWPLTEHSSNMPVPEAEIKYIGEDSYGKIYRITIEIFSGLETYGILFVPKGEGPFPLIISQHGGGGTPELCSGFFGSANYNDMTRRILKRGIAVFAPQLLLWGEEFGPKYDRRHIDAQLKQLGGSITAVEIFKIIRSLDYLSAREDIQENSIGMIGLSYGGFYALFTAACDLRIKAALSSCFFNNRFVYDWSDWTWFNAGNTFLDPEVCGLICPRYLYIEVGKHDELFDYSNVKKEFEKAESFYKKLGVVENIRLKEFDGGHELDVSDDGIEFLCSKILV